MKYLIFFLILLFAIPCFAQPKFFAGRWNSTVNYCGLDISDKACHFIREFTIVQVANRYTSKEKAFAIGCFFAVGFELWEAFSYDLHGKNWILDYATDPRGGEGLDIIAGIWGASVSYVFCDLDFSVSKKDEFFCLNYRF